MVYKHVIIKTIDMYQYYVPTKLFITIANYNIFIPIV